MRDGWEVPQHRPHLSSRRVPARSARYTDAEVRHALLVLAVHSGHTERAAGTLREQGLAVTARTLLRWREETHADTYAECVHEKRAEIDQRLAASYLHAIEHATRGMDLAVHKAIDQLEAGEARDPAAVARNLATTAGISQDKMFALQGRPASAITVNSVDDNLKFIAEVLGMNVTDADIVELTELNP